MLQTGAYLSSGNADMNAPGNAELKGSVNLSGNSPRSFFSQLEGIMGNQDDKICEGRMAFRIDGIGKFGFDFKLSHGLRDLIAKRYVAAKENQMKEDVLPILLVLAGQDTMITQMIKTLGAGSVLGAGTVGYRTPFEEEEGVHG
jgi:hypothetical protein